MHLDISERVSCQRSLPFSRLIGPDLALHMSLGKTLRRLVNPAAVENKKTDPFAAYHHAWCIRTTSLVCLCHGNRRH